MAYPSVTYSFTNGTTISAAEVNQNFTDLINGASDGTKDYNIGALTCAGTANLNGAVNLGNATSDDITITGYVASAIIPKTDNTYDLGTAALAWKDAYFDGSVKTDAIDELTGAAGVTIDGLLIKDNGLQRTGVVISDGTGTAAVTVVAGGGLQLGLSGQKSLSKAAFGVSGASAGGWGASHLILDYASGNGRFIAIGADATTRGGFQFYGTESDDGNTTEFARCSNAGAWSNISGGSWGTISDFRLKKNIENLENGLTTILALRPVKYAWRDENVSELRPTEHFIAQEVEAVNPKWVTEGATEKIIEDGVEVEIENCKQVNLDASFNAYLVKAIQELEARLAVLEAK
jgi:hypothetical protein